MTLSLNNVKSAGELYIVILNFRNKLYFLDFASSQAESHHLLSRFLAKFNLASMIKSPADWPT